MRKSQVFYIAVFIVSILPGCQSYGSQTGTEDSSIKDPSLQEISGIAASNLLPGHLWLVNDSGNSPTLYLADEDYRVKQEVSLSVKNRDWEDLASFVLDGQSWIMIAETGDNRHRHSSGFLYFFREDTLLKPLSNTRAPEKTIEFTYSDGSKNCEAVAVDVVSRKILLLNKSQTVSSLYELPLLPGNSKEKLTARHTATLQAFAGRESASLIKALTGVNPDTITGMDIIHDGSRAFVLTYRDIWEFRKMPDNSWAETFSQPANHVSGIKLRQAEAVAVSSDESSILVTTEGIPAAVLSFEN